MQIRKSEMKPRKLRKRSPRPNRHKNPSKPHRNRKG